MIAKFLTLICLCLVLASPAWAANKTKKRSTTQSGPNALQNLSKSGMLPYYMWGRSGGSRRGPSAGAGYGGPIIVSPSAFGYPVGGF